MDLLDLSYWTTIATAGAVARAVAPALPEGWRLRLDAAPPADRPVGWIWLHAVSVGELLLAEPVIRVLRDAGHAVHVTTGTPAGLELLGRRLPGWDQGGGLVTGGAFPVDDPEGLRPFLVTPPALFLGLETELWPNLFRTLEAHGVPRVIINGRLTERTLASRGLPWLRRAAGRLTRVVARDADSAAAFRRLGAPDVVLGGNLKADAPAPRPLHAGWESLRRAWSGDPVLVAGNTLEGEEALLLDCWRRCRTRRPGLRMILAPRQPRRFGEVARFLESEGVRHLKASAWPAPGHAWEETDVLLLDTLGDLAAAYGEGTVALVAGGWTWHGGHNPLEGVRWGVPTLIGPGFANFEDLVTPLLAGGLVQVAEGASLEASLEAALDGAPLRPERTWGAADLPPELMGTLEKTLRYLQEVFPLSPRPAQE